VEDISEVNEERAALTEAIKELNFKSKRSEHDMDSMLNDISLHEQKVQDVEAAARKQLKDAEKKCNMLQTKYESA